MTPSLIVPLQVHTLNTMKESQLGNAYHIERALAARQGIPRYPCRCERCHGFKTQKIEIVEIHHRKYGRDQRLTEPLLRNPVRQAEAPQDAPQEDAELDEEEHVHGEQTQVDEEEEYVDANDFETFEPTPPNRELNLDDMAENFFARAVEIHEEFTVEEDEVLDFDDLSSEEDEPDRTEVVEELLRQAAEPSFTGSSTNRLQFSIILMSLCTLYSISHHCLDEILTFLKHDVLLANNNCPKSSYEMKTLLMKLGLSHDSIRCCDCG